MDRERAATIDRLTRDASRLLDESMGRIRDECAERAAGVYRSSIGRVMGEMAAGLLFPIWREHPELEPESMKEPSTYNPREFEMPPAAADYALATFAKARATMEQVLQLVNQEADSSDRQAYAGELEGIMKAIDDAVGYIQRRRQASK